MRYPVAVVALLIAVVPLTAQSYRAPRTPDGHPDLQGIWQVMNTAAVNLEDHIATLGMPAGRSVIVDPPDGKIPYTPAAAQQQKENYKNRAKADPLNICYIPGVPRVMYLPFPIQIVQTPKFVLMASEFAHTLRRIFMDGSKAAGFVQTRQLASTLTLVRRARRKQCAIDPLSTWL